MIPVRTDLTVKKKDQDLGPLRGCTGCRHLSAGPFPRRDCAHGHYVTGDFHRGFIDGEGTLSGMVICDDYERDS